jgi:hypothetical protein
MYVNLFKAMDFFGCPSEVVVSVVRALRQLFNTYTLEKMLELANILYFPMEHPEHIPLSNAHCSNMQYRIINMTTVAELNSVYNFVLDISDEELRSEWERSAIRIGTKIAVERVEGEISAYLERHVGIEHMAVDWNDLKTSGLSQRFINNYKHLIALRNRHIEMFNLMPDNLDMVPLHLYNLPIKVQAVKYAMTSIGTPEFWNRRQINDSEPGFMLPNHTLVRGNEQWNNYHRITLRYPW